jgi:hypothetical protein
MGLLDDLTQQLGAGTVQNLSRQLGADEGATGKALSAALPMLMGALSRNASRPEGADALSRAVDRDHDGGILDDIPGFLKNFQSSQGDGILGHVLGNRRGAVEAGISRTSGLDAGSVSKLLAMVAPLVMGALGRAKRGGGMDAGALSQMLGTESKRVEEAMPGAGGLLSSLLDQDGDGQVADDVANLGMNLLGKFLGGKK